MPRLTIVSLTALFALGALSIGCDGGRQRPASRPATVEAPVSNVAPVLAKPPVRATDLDPTAMDEALRQALVALHNKYRCNSISGCKAHRILVDFGEHARPALQHMFPAAPFQAHYRARIIRIIADMQSPAARPFLRGVLRDASDRARAYAVYGLVLLDDRRDQEMMHTYANAPGIIASAMTRVAAAWGLAYLGEHAYAERFVDLVREAANHQLGGATLRWALELCRVPHSPPCENALALAARHPSYVVRREVLRSVETDPNWDNSGQPGGGPTWKRAKPAGGGKVQLAGLGRAHRAPKNEEKTGPNAMRTRPHLVQSRSVDGSASAKQALVMLAADPSVNLARRAETALRRISGRRDLHGAAAWRGWLAAQSGVAPNRQGQAARPATAAR